MGRKAIPVNGEIISLSCVGGSRRYSILILSSGAQATSPEPSRPPFTRGLCRGGVRPDTLFPVRPGLCLPQEG